MESSDHKSVNNNPTKASNPLIVDQGQQAIMAPLQRAVTWYKIRHAGEQAVHWDIQNKATSSRQICIFFVVDVPVRSLLSSMVDFGPLDHQNTQLSLSNDQRC